MLLINFLNYYFKDLQNVEGPFVNIISFIKLFYGAHSSLHHQHGQHKEGITIIESSSGMKQGDPLGGPLFVSWPIIKHS